MCQERFELLTNCKALTEPTFHRLWELWSCELSRFWDRTEAADCHSMATWKASVIPLALRLSGSQL